MADLSGEVAVLDPRRNQSVGKKKLFEEMLLKEIPGTTRTNEPMHAVLEGELAESEMVEGREAQNVRNRALLHYLASLANSNSTKDTFDFDFVESLLQNGADVNSTDKTGQTVFHEVARSWNSDVASFLISNGANVNQQDQYGRSPLHVAAAVDYAEMVEFLLQNGADIDIKTSGEDQAPIHFAAKNDAINSLQMLLKYGADIDARDSKNRTPLQVAAEMNRSKAAKLLISEGAPAGVYDNLGNSALSLLIEKIPEVALDAMDQFHSVDMINRKEFYFLNYLEGTKLKKQKTPARTPLEIAVQNERYDVIMHPVMQRLIGVKWQSYGKWGAVQDLAINLAYTMLWTLLAVTLPRNGKDLYIPIVPNSWRLIIGIFLIILTMVEIRKQILNTTKTRQEHNAWKEWRASELERDIEHCHPRWPQEAQYVNAEIKAVRNLSLMSGSDYWIYFDWVALVFILATIVSHVVFFYYGTDLSKEIHHYITMPLLLILWFRIFKYARPFESAGPFVVIFGSVMGDIVKWGFLNLVVVIPFTCAFWMTFGGVSLEPVEGYDQVGPLLYNIFSMMVVNDHGFENLERANPFMARLLCGSFICIAAIVTLNLLIALLSNTFERLYENAVANAVMQRAQTILLLQKSLRQNQKSKYYNFIKESASPEVVSCRLMTTDNEEVTIERVRDDVQAIMNTLGEQFGKKFQKGKKSDLDFVKMDVSKVRRVQEEIVANMKKMQLSLDEIKEKIQFCANNNLIHATMNSTASKSKHDHNNNDDKTDANDEGTHGDSTNDSSSDDNDVNDHYYSYKKSTENNVYNASSSDVANNRSNHNKKRKKITTTSTMGDNFNDKKFGKTERTGRKEPNVENRQTKHEKKAESASENGCSETDYGSSSGKKGNDDLTKERLESDAKKDKKNRKKSDENDNGYDLDAGRKKNSQNELSNLGERRPHVPLVSEDRVARQEMVYSPGYLETARAISAHSLAQRPLPYPSRYPSSMFLPGMWEHTNIPYTHISQKYSPKPHDQNQLLYSQYNKRVPSAPAQFLYVDEKPDTASTLNDSQQYPSDYVFTPHRMAYFPETEYRGNTFPKNPRLDQSLYTPRKDHSILEGQASRITENKSQTVSDASRTLTTQHDQQLRSHAFPNHGFQVDNEILHAIPPTRYPPEDQVSTRYGIPFPHGYPQDDKNQSFSPGINFYQNSTTPRHVAPSVISPAKPEIPNIESKKSSFTAIPRSQSSSGFSLDQNSAHTAAVTQKEKHKRSMSLQLTRSESKIIPRRRQSENLNVNRLTFQMAQQEFREPLHNLTPAKQGDDSVTYSQNQTSLSGSGEDCLDEKKTGEFQKEERFVISTPPAQPKGGNEIFPDESKA